MRTRFTRIFANLTSEPDPDDHDTAEHRKDRLIPLSGSPFENDEPQNRSEDRRRREWRMSTATGGSVTSLSKDDEERGVRPPAWLDLFFDLAWAATFANLTENNKFSSGMATLSYAVFFTIAWWIWVSQVMYDTRFYTNDWLHRIVCFLQLGLFGALAAFTRNFDVTLYIQHIPQADSLEALTGSESYRAAQNFVAGRYPKLAFKGIALTIAISRTLLLAQYLRVIFYFKMRRGVSFLFIPLGLFCSAALFYTSFALLIVYPESRDVHIAKFALWAVGLALEAAAHLAAQPPTQLRTHGSITTRLGTLVTIILGEGCTSMAGAFQFVAQSPVFDYVDAGLVVSAALIIFLIFYLYFEGSRPQISKYRRMPWVMVHLPYMLSVVVLLEGLKNLLLLSSAWRTSIVTTEKFFAAFTAPQMDQGNIAIVRHLNETVGDYLWQFGLSYDDAYSDQLALIFSNGTQTDISKVDYFEVSYIWLTRLSTKVAMSLFTDYFADGPDAETAILYNQLITNETLLAQEYLQYNGTASPAYAKFLNSAIGKSTQSVQYISALAGAILISLAVLNVVQSVPKDRYQWGSVISRWTMGWTLVALLLLNLGAPRDYSINSPQAGAQGIALWWESYWLMPTLAIALMIQAIIDFILLLLSSRATEKSTRRARLHLSTPTDGARYDNHGMPQSIPLLQESPISAQTTEYWKQDHFDPYGSQRRQGSWNGQRPDILPYEPIMR